ncbi:hypothetical protein RD055328_00500 [Companilactobacillus sp. RD055328]|uniref:MutH/Sau3AI family endonuclease n=1 Tax=Companilactobacillus sp. RD055328 TaxID=2916634 RepID=UPI001FC89DF5|nr:MutH/Sau3AI family endonuclease [Companilactobacillus sp. RD055328]GKQ42127.1 hypothetical protein RD055328_00500 [Companilactobacillus sp. RD055328]
MDINHKFTKKELTDIFNKVINKTLGEVDVNHVFDKTIVNPKVTGIAGDVVEQSIIGYPADSKQRPDLIVDDKEVELKTTGLKKSKKKFGALEAKEPMSITAVSPDKISNQKFESSDFWHKLERLLLVYYLYDSDTTVKASDYARFPIMGYEFHEFSNDEKEILKNDWLIVRNYIKELQENYDNPKDYYPTISSKLRPDLMLIDTAPKWPNPPRFRLKRTTVSTIVENYFTNKELEKLDKNFGTFNKLDERLHEFTEKYSGKTIESLIKALNIQVNLNKKGDVSKSVTEQIVTRMFGAESKKISKIDIFNKIGLVAKTITQTKSGMRTEDTKLFPVDFEEWLDKDNSFEESSAFSDFSERQFLFVIFEEQNSNEKLLCNKFVGFKRVTFSDEFIFEEVLPVWNYVRDTIFNDKLIETVDLDSNGNQRINSNGTIKTSVNLPKSADYKIFFRGTGQNSSDKPVYINGIHMYRQYVWIRGTEILKMLSSQKYI